ncbi:MAG: hypothetical protein J7M18_08025, partial [Candidatus Eremiobacteraeota bacterium]|nr:hypothetical protein [Candidatus Eremiobacteraeota bacterium]
MNVFIKQPLGLIPLGNIAPDLTDSIRHKLAGIWKGPVEIMEQVSSDKLPGFRNERGQYFAPSILAYLSRYDYPGILLGITIDDIYEPGLKFIRGVCLEGGRSALISLRRLGGDIAGEATEQALHEIGHLAGLSHCTSNCFMQRAETRQNPGQFCQSCADQLENTRPVKKRKFPSVPLRFIYSPGYSANIGIHVFPILKFRKVAEALRKEGVKSGEFLTPAEITRADLELVHDGKYLDDLFNLKYAHSTMLSELPLTEEIVNAFVLAAGGTYRAVSYALNGGAAVNLTGGFHHAFADHAEGFCYLNDTAVAIKMLQHEGKLNRAAVIDLDLHQGNGTAYIFRDSPEIFTFSIHQEN